MKPKLFKLVVYTPIENAPAVRRALGKAGAGRIGNYEYGSFCTEGVGRFRPLKGANPTIGTIGALEEVREERIECVVQQQDLQAVLKATRKAHPYEEPVIDVIELVDV